MKSSIKPFSLTRLTALAISFYLGSPGLHAQAISTDTPSPDAFFSWVERSFPEVFPSGPANQMISPYTVRAYATGNYIGLANSRVYALGPITGNQLLDLGLISQFTCQISPSATGCSQSTARPANSLVTDTGIPADRCLEAGNTVSFVSCTSAAAIKKQDGALGLDIATPDNSDGSLGFKYSVYEKDGQRYAKEDCVLDKNTGLLWEVKVNDVLNFRHYGINYTHYTSTAKQEKEICSTINSSYTCIKSNPTQDEIDSTSNAATYVKKVNEIGLCGRKDWRIPSWQELYSLVHYGKLYKDNAAQPQIQPQTETTWFPNTQTGSYLSSTPDAKTDTRVWLVNFGPGAVGASSAYSRSNSENYSDRNFLRLVSGLTTDYNSTNRYELGAGGSEVSDRITGLVWKRCAEGMTWSGSTCTGTATQFSAFNALKHAAGTTGWRIPNIKELASIIDSSGYYPAISTIAFPATPSTGTFFTSTPSNSESYTVRTAIPSTPFLRTITFFYGSFTGGSPYGQTDFYVRLVKE